MIQINLFKCFNLIKFTPNFRSLKEISIQDPVNAIQNQFLKTTLNNYQKL